MKLRFQADTQGAILPYDYPARIGREFYRRTEGDHDGQSLHSIGWIRGGEVDVTRQGFVITGTPRWSLGVGRTGPLEAFLESVDEDPEILPGVQIRYPEPVSPPAKETVEYVADSPILARRGREHLRYDDPEADAVLTRSLETKLHKLTGGEVPVQAAFAPTDAARTKVMSTGKAEHRGNLCRIRVETRPEAQKLVPSVGVGALTGMGFGSVLPEEAM
ncbi:MAG: CRISPR-associated endoribonuclease Cas6 [Salinibacter sp.]